MFEPSTPPPLRLQLSSESDWRKLLITTTIAEDDSWSRQSDVVVVVVVDGDWQLQQHGIRRWRSSSGNITTGKERMTYNT